MGAGARHGREWAWGPDAVHPPPLSQHLFSALGWWFPLCTVIPALVYICLCTLAVNCSRSLLALLGSAPQA